MFLIQFYIQIHLWERWSQNQPLGKVEPNNVGKVEPNNVGKVEPKSTFKKWSQNQPLGKVEPKNLYTFSHLKRPFYMRKGLNTFT